MKKLWLLLLFLVLLLGACSNSTSSSGGKKEYTFRDTYWGMTKEEVKKSADNLDLIGEENRYNQSLVDLNDSDYLFYETYFKHLDTPGDENAIVYFNFDKEKLVSAGYRFDAKYNFLTFPNEEKVNKLIGGIMADLKEKYGKFKEKDYVDGLVKEYIWETDDTIITLEVKTGIHPQIKVRYVSKEWWNDSGKDFEDL
ncbi:hypothetical protein [Neobacillus mesonae]|uniref:hypothetical protein n=1 Tax=Neobacillus mesonae TaxID=1193713 RepID=UPI00257481F2|nr:hypothetical protein [Neobacillus mesonae]